MQQYMYFFMAFKHKNTTVAITQSKGGCREQAGWNTWRKAKEVRLRWI